MVASIMVFDPDSNGVAFVQAAGGFLSYFVVMGECGFLPYTLIGLRSDWDSSTTIVQDSYGQDWVSGREREGG